MANASRPYKRIGRATTQVKAVRTKVDSKKRRLAVKTGIAQAAKTVSSAKQLKRELDGLTASVTLGADKSLSNKLDYLIDEVDQLKRNGSKVERKLINEGSLASVAGLTMCILLIAPIGFGLSLAQRAKQGVVNGPFWVRQAIGLIKEDPTAIAAESDPRKDSTPLKKSDAIGPWQVTSPFDPNRLHPVHGDIRPHNGVDVNTPIGTPLYAPVPVDVDCWVDSGGGGQVATLYKPNSTTIVYQALHLEYGSCKAGFAKQGVAIANTGNTGTGTGPHLHWEEIKAGTKVPPTRGPLLAALGIASKPSSDTVSLIKELESFTPEPYWDRHQYSWGYGTKAPEATGTITKDDALAELNAYLATHCYPLTQPLNLQGHQAAAINSFCYNVGPEQFSDSKLYANLLTGDHDAAAEEFSRWTKSNGVELPGLVARRGKEKQLFIGGV